MFPGHYKYGIVVLVLELFHVSVGVAESRNSRTVLQLGVQFCGMFVAL